MADNWLPGADRSPQAGGVTLNQALPARAIWHITWDKISETGQQPPFSAVSNYLKNVGYCPHLMWNPFTGYVEQYYPADVGGRALAAWNQDGVRNIQIEVFFTPGCVVDGKQYDTVAETPCKGLDKIMAWLRSHGIADQWPLGAPQWQGNSRNADVWNRKSGHYGHSQVPDNTHTDPGPMPNLFAVGAAPAAVTPKKEDDVPESIYHGRHKDTKLPKGKWVTLPLTNDGLYSHLDGDRAHKTMNLLNLIATGLPKGNELQLRYVVVDYVKGKPTKLHKVLHTGEVVGTGGGTAGQLAAHINLPKGSRYRLRVQACVFTDGVTITQSHLDTYYWKR